MFHYGDTVAGSAPINGAKNRPSRPNEKPGRAEHSVNSFMQEEINTNIPQHPQSPRGGSSKKEENPIIR